MKVQTLNNLQQRVLVGIVGGATVIAALLSGQWGYFLLFLVLMVACQWEFYRLLKLASNLPLAVAGIVISVGLYVSSYLIIAGWIPLRYLVVNALSLSLIFLIKLYKKGDKEPFKNIGYTLTGVAYTCLPFCLFHLAVFQPHGHFDEEIVIGTLLLLWASDSGAYFAGRSLGKTKLFERVSPKKTWEGFAGGMALALIIAYLLGLYFKSLDPWHWLAMGFTIVVAGTYGDLVESLFKRSLEVKDSSSLLPGHGGFLDRFDGLLLSAPFVAALLILWP